MRMRTKTSMMAYSSSPPLQHSLFFLPLAPVPSAARLFFSVSSPRLPPLPLLLLCAPVPPRYHPPSWSPPCLAPSLAALLVHLLSLRGHGHVPRYAVRYIRTYVNVCLYSRVQRYVQTGLHTRGYVRNTFHDEDNSFYPRSILEP